MTPLEVTMVVAINLICLASETALVGCLVEVMSWGRKSITDGVSLLPMTAPGGGSIPPPPHH